MRLYRRPALAAALLLVGIGRAAAQSEPLVLGDDTAGSPASQFTPTNYEWRSAPASFHEVTVAAERPPVAGMASSRLEGLDQKRFGFSSVTAYFQRVLGPEADRSSLTSSALLQLWLVTERRDGHRRWWRFGERAEAGVRALPFDSLVITDEPDKEVSPDDLVFASPARGSEPVVVVRYGAKMFGANSGSSTTHHLIVDLRSGIPVARGLFDAVEHDCGGACTHDMCLYAVNEAVGCRWDTAADDFLCAGTLHRTDTRWTSRRASRRFRLLGGKALPWTSARPPADLDPSVPQAVVSAKPGDAAVVETVGAIAVVADVPVGSRMVRLFGAPALTWSFGARLFQATLDGGRRSPIAEIGSHVQAPDGGAAAKALGGDHAPASGLTPDGASPRFASSVVARSGGTTIVRVAVAEGEGHGVYLVGLEDAEGGVIADSVQVATDGRSYRECGTWMVPTTAVRMTLTSEPFSATLDVEPEGLVTDDGDPAVPDEDAPRTERCRKMVTLAWQAGVGFAVTRSEADCDSRPVRLVRIDDAGNIGSVPAPAPRPPR